MPYSGIEPGSELEKKIERCVEDVMAKHKGEKGFEKSNAIAICRDSIEKKGNEQKAEGGIELQPVTAQEMEDLPNLFYGGEADKNELMKFSGALLCTVGTNRNGDGIVESGIEELADSIKYMAICDNHEPTAVVGFMLDGRAKNKSTELRGNGVVFARRFPDAVEAIRTGKKKISIEAVAKEARCGECDAVFSSPREYCEHLKAKTATRWLSSLSARGIAIVEHPAWETTFGDDNSFVMIASELDCGCTAEKETIKEPTWVGGLKAWFEKKLLPVMEMDAGIDKCYCEKCDKEFPHERGQPCSEAKCPQCGEMMQPVTEVEAADDKKKWSKDVDLKEGSLESLGWPSYEKLAKALKEGRVSYKKLVGKLVFLQNITKDSATKRKAASFIKRLQKAHESKTEGGTLMADFEIVEGETLEEFSARLGLVAANEVSAKEEELKTQFEAEKAELQAGFDTEKEGLKAEAEKVKVGFERALELDLGADEATILAGLDEDAYDLFKRQREEKEEETAVQASEEEEEVTVEAGKLQGNVLSTTEKVNETLSLQDVGAFLSKKIQGGK